MEITLPCFYSGGEMTFDHEVTEKHCTSIPSKYDCSYTAWVGIVVISYSHVLK
jgi:hypothetical protein